MVLEQAVKGGARNCRRRTRRLCLNFSSFCRISPRAGPTLAQKIPKEARITESMFSKESAASFAATFPQILCLVHSCKNPRIKQTSDREAAPRTSRGHIHVSAFRSPEARSRAARYARSPALQRKRCGSGKVFARKRDAGAILVSALCRAGAVQVACRTCTAQSACDALPLCDRENSIDGGELHRFLRA